MESSVPSLLADRRAAAGLLLLSTALLLSTSATAAPETPPARSNAAPPEAAEKGGFASRWNVVVAAEDLSVAGVAFVPREVFESERGSFLNGDTEEYTVYRTSTAWGIWSPVRFAADVFPIPRLSLGVAVRVDHQTSKIKYHGEYSLNGRVEHRSSDATHWQQTAITFTPRVGYALPLGSRVATWFRAGMQLGQASGVAEDAYDPRAEAASPGPRIGVTAEALLVVEPVKHAVLGVGPTFRTTQFGGVFSTSHLAALTLNAGLQF
jgi:hypothetical protein